ncbi:MAG TPA: TlyA family RNA methyltransferase [Anaerolineales bacterium]|nr:TlyA family RNA methyltransferase [Anaerolineales bacterium]
MTRGRAASKPEKRLRLDAALLELGLAESRASAQRLILAGEVRVDGEPAAKASQLVAADARLEVLRPPPYVSRGGDKLAAALAGFGLDVTGKVCADVGASTGGFTDCLLQRGAARVFAIDVGHGILHWKLRQDPRVTVMERTNVRYLGDLETPIQVATIDVAFISLRLVLPVVSGWLVPSGDVVALVKPQFEAGRRLVGKGGVVRDPTVHRQVLEAIAAEMKEADLGVQGVIRSPLRGPKGNLEFLMWAVKGGPTNEGLQGRIEAVSSAQ